MFCINVFMFFNRRHVLSIYFTWDSLLHVYLSYTLIGKCWFIYFSYFVVWIYFTNRLSNNMYELFRSDLNYRDCNTWEIFFTAPFRVPANMQWNEGFIYKKLRLPRYWTFWKSEMHFVWKKYIKRGINFWNKAVLESATVFKNLQHILILLKFWKLHEATLGYSIYEWWNTLTVWKKFSILFPK